MKTTILILIVIIGFTSVEAQKCDLTGCWYRFVNKDSITIVFTKDKSFRMFSNRHELTIMNDNTNKESKAESHYEILDSDNSRKEGIIYLNKDNGKGQQFYFTFIDCENMLMETKDIVAETKARFKRIN